MGPRLQLKAALAVASGVILAGGIAASAALTPSRVNAPLHELCSAGYVSATINGEAKCLHAGEFCSAADESQYESYGFTCDSSGRLEASGGGGGTTTTTPATTSSTMPAPYLGGFVEATNPRAVAAYSSCFPAAGATITSGTLAWGDGQSANVGASTSNLDHQVRLCRHVHTDAHLYRLGRELGAGDRIVHSDRPSGCHDDHWDVDTHNENSRLDQREC